MNQDPIKNVGGIGQIIGEYLAFYANKTSEYIILLDKLKRTIELKVKQQQYQSLLQSVVGIEIKNERKILMETFDKLFLQICPNFIHQLNSLLKPEHHFHLKNANILNTNIRIFALMRLGITDNNLIADILESSVSTIYTYKFRFKHKALSSSVLEDQLLTINFFNS